jgi:hypothetical protein
MGAILVVDCVFMVIEFNMSNPVFSDCFDVISRVVKVFPRIDEMAREPCEFVIGVEPSVRYDMAEVD